MSQVDAFSMVNHVRERLSSLAAQHNFLRDKKISDKCRRIWTGPGRGGGLVSDLWVEGAYPARSSEMTLGDLSRSGKFPEDLCALLDQSGALPKDRPLYSHQEEALQITSTADKPAMVVTAGTGAGKTEAFLLPILRDLWSVNRPFGEGGKGMRCLILYPTNALVADQVERLHAWLKQQQGDPRIRIFHFTSETPEDRSAANSSGCDYFEPCRMRTRKEARGKEGHDRDAEHLGANLSDATGPIPDIVITNYSMLEYMLCRPQDACFFGKALRAIVLDEAHLYTGNLAAEITLLLRRVRQRCGVGPDKMLQIATSATLGGTPDDLKTFASTLFSRDINSTHVIVGQREPLENSVGSEESQPVEAVSSQLILKGGSQIAVSTLTEDGEFLKSKTTVDSLLPLAKALTAEQSVDVAQTETPDAPAPFLFSVLRRSPVIRRMAQVLYEKERLALADLARSLFESPAKALADGGLVDAEKATTLLLRLAAAARQVPGQWPLIPHRLYFVCRGPDGLSVCLDSNCSGPSDQKMDGLGCLQASTDACQYCGCVALPLLRCETCGEWVLGGYKSGNRILPKPEDERSDRLYLRTAEPEKPFVAHRIGPQGYILPNGGTLLHEGRNGNGTACCPTCKTEWVSSRTDDDDEWEESGAGPIRGNDALFLPVAAETVLADVPQLPGNDAACRPNDGRRLLCFSDSRTEAARLGPRLMGQHETQYVRSMIARALMRQGAPTQIERLRRHREEDIATARRRAGEEGIEEGDAERLREEVRRLEAELQELNVGIGYSRFCNSLSSGEFGQILDRNSGRRQTSTKFTREEWFKNQDEVKAHAEALVGTEINKPLRREPSLEAAGLVEVVYPGLDRLACPFDFAEDEVDRTIRELWPQFLAALLDTFRFDRLVGWSVDNDDRKWLDDSPLEGWWASEDVNRPDKGIRRFVGSTPRQLRRKFAKSVYLSARKSAGLADDGAAADRWAEKMVRSAFGQLQERSITCNEARDPNFVIMGDRLPWLLTGTRRIRLEGQVAAPQPREANDREVTCVRIALDRLTIRIPRLLHRCPSTETFWPRSVLGWAPIKGCLGGLVEIKPEEANEHPRWGRARSEMLNSDIFKKGLWADEHSAQLDPAENRRLQDLFRSGIRNILSSTTTMELGIDIGGLSAVLLGNVPPGKANLLQRAGRAGRRADGSAVVAVYARCRAFDSNVFADLAGFLAKPLRKPVVLLDRERLVRKHIQAFLLGQFFTEARDEYAAAGAMRAFGDMGGLCGCNEPPRWDGTNKPTWENEGMDSLAKAFRDSLRCWQQDPKELLASLASIVVGTKYEDVVGDTGKWRIALDQAIETFGKSIEDWRAEFDSLAKVWNGIQNGANDSAREKRFANMTRWQLLQRCDQTVIECLAESSFLPRYGFPIHVHRLKVEVGRSEQKKARRTGSKEGEFRLERPSMLALAEYVPGSKVLVGGRLVTSRGILKHWVDNTISAALGLEKFICLCANGHRYTSSLQDGDCPHCKTKPSQNGQGVLLPRYGYTSAAWDAPKYSKMTERIGEMEAYPLAEFSMGAEGVEQFDKFGGIPGLDVIYQQEAELFVCNSGEKHLGFAMCTRCGYAASEEEGGEGRINLPKGFADHAPIFSEREGSYCWQQNEPAPVLRHKVLAASEKTDMLLIKWPHPASDAALYSLGRALVIAGTRLLELDARELGIELQVFGDGGKKGIVVYDTAPGGSGHCRELAQGDLQRPWIEEAWIVLSGGNRDRGLMKDHDGKCDRACLHCILDFAGQHSARNLDRRSALRILAKVSVGQREQDELSLFPREWWKVVEELRTSGWKVEPGSDVAMEARIIGASLAVLKKDDRTWVLVDERKSAWEQVVAVLKEEGLVAVSVRSSVSIDRLKERLSREMAPGECSGLGSQSVLSIPDEDEFALEVPPRGMPDGRPGPHRFRRVDLVVDPPKIRSLYLVRTEPPSGGGSPEFVVGRVQVCMRDGGKVLRFMPGEERVRIPNADVDAADVIAILE